MNFLEFIQLVRGKRNQPSHLIAESRPLTTTIRGAFVEEVRYELNLEGCT